MLAHLAKHYKQFGEEPPKELDIPYVSVATIEKRVLAALAVIDVERLAQKAIAESLDRARGRV